MPITLKVMHDLIIIKKMQVTVNQYTKCTEEYTMVPFMDRDYFISKVNNAEKYIVVKK
jgi:hypothetical protein